MLEIALKRDFLSSNFETATELLGLPEDAFASDFTCAVSVLPWIPKTTGGVALRLFEFDSSIFYTPDQMDDPQKDKESEDFIVSIKLTNHVICLLFIFDCLLSQNTEMFSSY